MCLAGEGGLSESIVVSTCARIEAYALAKSAGETSVDNVLETVTATLFSESHGALPAHNLRGAAAYGHALRTAAGLLSSLPGDTDVRLQLCSATRMARDVGNRVTAMGAIMDRVSEGARALSRDTTWGDFRVGFADVVMDSISRASSIPWELLNSIVILGDPRRHAR